MRIPPWLAVTAFGATLLFTIAHCTPHAGADGVAGVTPQPNPVELGWVDWGRDYDKAAAISARTGKPIFLLFQEVPGCATCVGFGESVLAHPLLIEAIETEFVPLAIHNNKGGDDARVLAKFSEPSWNNPVVRFVDGAGQDLIPRADGVWATSAITRRMIASLEAAKRPVPDYLRWVLEESTAATRRATFEMYCYWAGEACLGDIDGVVATSAGWLDGSEVVEVEYDKARLSEEKLRALASERGCGRFVAKAARARNAKDSDRKFHLKRSAWNYVPLTPRQATRVNAAVQAGKDPSPWVSPGQKALYSQIVSARKKRPEALKGLQRPDDPDQLARYRHRLRTRLASILPN